jgi:crotonobetainyl-CoA:carnitine CoA-transferase CaiB-like acyl-CoA transferase
MGALGIVSRLTHRDRTGVGSRVDVNMVDSSMWILAELSATGANGPGPQPNIPVTVVPTPTPDFVYEQPEAIV